MVAEICRYSVSGNKNLSADTPVFNQSEFRIWFGLVCAWRNPTWKFLSGLEKVIYQMKKSQNCAEAAIASVQPSYVLFGGTVPPNSFSPV